MADWIQSSWEKGDSLALINDALCGSHHYEPWTCRGLPQSWKVFSVWRKLESPNRAPPLTRQICDSWILYALSHNDLEFAALISLGFYTLLRTDELVQVCPQDLLLGDEHGLVSLTNSPKQSRTMDPRGFRSDRGCIYLHFFLFFFIFFFFFLF